MLGQACTDKNTWSQDGQAKVAPSGEASESLTALIEIDAQHTESCVLTRTQADTTVHMPNPVLHQSIHYQETSVNPTRSCGYSKSQTIS